MNLTSTDVILIIFIIVTIFAIVKGGLEARRQISDIRSGKSAAQVKKEYEERQKQKQEKEERKFDSKLYRWTHPVEYLELLAEKKIKERREKK